MNFFRDVVQLIKIFTVKFICCLMIQEVLLQTEKSPNFMSEMRNYSFSDGVRFL